MMIKEYVKRIPVLLWLGRRLKRFVHRNVRRPEDFPGSQKYWEDRYAKGGDSGAGSYDKFAAFKAEVLNAFVEEHGITTVVEFGCGDGNQLTLANYTEYLGVDVSPTAVAACEAQFAGDESKTFTLSENYGGEKAELSLSLDVLYHLIENAVFEQYMHDLFASSLRFVIIYSSNTDENEGYLGSHVFHRTFTEWILENRPQWQLIEHIPNRYPYEGDYLTGSFADFYIFAKS